MTASTFKKPTKTGERASAIALAAWLLWFAKEEAMVTSVTPACSSARRIKSGREESTCCTAAKVSPLPKEVRDSPMRSTSAGRNRVSKTHCGQGPPRAEARQAARTAPKKWAAERINPR